MHERPQLGEYFSEGARRLWLEMDKRKLSQADLADRLGTSSGQVNKWLFGNRRASLTWALKIESAIGVPAKLWAEDSREEDFRPPSHPTAA